MKAINEKISWKFQSEKNSFNVHKKRTQKENKSITYCVRIPNTNPSAA